MKSVAWWRLRFMESAAAAVVVFVVIQLSVEVADRQKELLPASSWLVVNEVYVPDFPVGEFPQIIYDRDIRENFDAFWIVEVQKTVESGLWTTLCSGSGVNEYDPSEVIPDNKTTWVWFTNTECEMEPGEYRLKTTYTMTRLGWPRKRLFALSNQFHVTDPEAASAQRPD